ncbi:MAG: NifU family protein [Gammaproteobacteria bacterium]|nr:NifU family protein [Gammaproteobacteria bacterium]
MSDSKDKALSHLLSENPLHFYTEDELDAIEEIDAVMALRIAKVQHLASSNIVEYQDVDIDMNKLDDAIAEVKKILSMDGGDIELVDIVDKVVRVQMKGACVGCPNAVMDLKNVVERIVLEKVPGVKAVTNSF